MVGCRDYLLTVGKNHSAVYFGIDAETVAQFSPLMASIFEEKKQAIFYATSSQSEILLPDSL
jgi:hypothetical protein